MSAKLKWYHNWKTICMWALIRSSKIWGKLLCSPKITIDYLCKHAKCLHSFFSNKEKFIRKRAQHCNQYLDLSGTPGPLGYHDLAKDTVPKVPTKDFKFLWLLYMQSIQQQSEVARKKIHIKMSGQLLSWLNSSELTLNNHWYCHSRNTNYLKFVGICIQDCSWHPPCHSLNSSLDSFSVKFSVKLHLLYLQNMLQPCQRIPPLFKDKHNRRETIRSPLTALPLLEDFQYYLSSPEFLA